jgi:integrase
MFLFLSTTIKEKEKLMIEVYFFRTPTLNRLRGGPLGSDLDDLATSLRQQGYAWDSIRGYLRGCDQFARWLLQQGYAVADVNQTLIKRYISGLQRPPSGRLLKAAEGLSHLLKLWRQKQRLPERIDTSPHTEADQWLLRYEQYLDQVCGTAASTRRHYLRMARCFLAACFGTGPLAWPSLQARQISDFVQQEAANKHGGGRKLPSTAVRSLLRFLVFSGELSPGLEAVALSPRQWTHDSIPKRLTAQEVERILALSAGETPVDLRNRAILMLLSRLGLRACEVVHLCLEDINWHEARFIIRSTKTHVTDCVKMYENRWFENVGANRVDQASPASPNIDADDTPSKMAYGSIWPLIRKLLPSMTTVSAWCSRRSRMAAVKVLSLLNILGHSLNARLEVIMTEPCS